MNANIPTTDEVRRFIMENHPVRGQWVYLSDAWRDLRAHRDYPGPVRDLLGQAVVASVLLAATLKFRGTLTLQLQGSGAVSLLVAQCTNDYRIRAVARFDEKKVEGVAAMLDGEDVNAEVFRALVGEDGRIVVTVESEDLGARYQGIVPLTGASSLEGALEAYFASSEQLPTRVRLVADASRGAGLLLQKMPSGDKGATEDAQEQAAWEAAANGLKSLSPAELLSSPIEQLLERGFSQHELRLFEGVPVQFQCRCSHERVAEVLTVLGQNEVREVLKTEGAVTVTCEFCNRPYRFDAVDVEMLFAAQSGKPPSQVLH